MKHCERVPADMLRVRHLNTPPSTGCGLQLADESKLEVMKSIRVERGSSVVECRTRFQVSPGSNPTLVPFRRLGIFILSVDAPVDSAA